LRSPHMATDSAELRDTFEFILRTRIVR
jgi:hypothetical protein